MADYFVTYREPQGADEITHNTIAGLNDCEDGYDLQEVIAHCTTVGCTAELFDAAGFRKGWVYADGTYRLQ